MGEKRREDRTDCTSEGEWKRGKIKDVWKDEGKKSGKKRQKGRVKSYKKERHR